MSTSHYSHRYEPAELDHIAWKIIEELQHNARISWAELGRRVGLTTPAVAERVHRLGRSADSGLSCRYQFGTSGRADPYLRTVVNVWT
jgi:Lrp/AsnC family leucine-responsive transcriptional regulator